MRGPPPLGDGKWSMGTEARTTEFAISLLCNKYGLKQAPRTEVRPDQLLGHALDAWRATRHGQGDDRRVRRHAVFSLPGSRIVWVQAHRRKQALARILHETRRDRSADDLKAVAHERLAVRRKKPGTIGLVGTGNHGAAPGRRRA